MPRPVGIFDSFDNLDQISSEAISSWLKPVPELNQLENYIANRIYYPKTIPLTTQDMQIDLAILREALKLNGPKRGGEAKGALLGENSFLNITLRKILIPIRFLDFVPNLTDLTLCFIDALLLDRKKEDWFQDLWTIVLTDDTDEIVGSAILPQFEQKNGVMNLELFAKKYEIRPGSFMIIPCAKTRCEIAYKLQNGKILGKSESAIEVYGGKLGLMVDGRGV